MFLIQLHQTVFPLFFYSELAPLHTTTVDTAIIKAKPGEGCPRCGGVVFAAELVLAKSRVSYYDKKFLPMYLLIIVTKYF